MTNLMHNEVYRQEMYRQANHRRLVHLVRCQPRPNVYRPLLAQLGRQMSYLGERLQEHYKDETLPGFATES